MKVLTSFYDDTTLLWADKLRRALAGSSFALSIVDETGSLAASELSARQRASVEPFIESGPNNPFDHPDYLSQFDVVATGKPSLELTELLSSESYRRSPSRPHFVAFHPGLSFTIKKGFLNRRDFDSVVANSRLHAIQGSQWLAEQPVTIEWYQPSLAPKRSWLGSTASDIDRVVFFTQAESPSTPASRTFMVDLVRTFATSRPDIETIVKLRSAPGENRGHVHKDLFPYTDLLTDSPPNLTTALDRAEDYFDAATLSFGCTTTVISEAVAHGAPTICYLDYPESWLDKLNLPMRRLMVGSGVIGSLDDIFDLQFRQPSEDWVSRNYRSDDFAKFFEKLIAQL